VLPPGSVGGGIAVLPKAGAPFRIEHPSGYFDVDVALAESTDGWDVTRSSALRTARKIFDGTVFPRPRL
jgi:4-oxalomesaconate tautomerase